MNIRFFLRFLSLAGIAFVSGSVVGQVPLEWTTPNNFKVSVPQSGSITFEAFGSVGGSYDAILAIDSSGSMADPAGQTAPNGGSQIGDWVISAAEGLISNLDPRVRLGIVEFDSNAVLHAPIEQLGWINDGTTHRENLIASLGTIDRTGSTNLVRPFARSATELLTAQQSSLSQQHIVLVSDGQINWADGNGRRQTQQHVRDEVERVFGLGIESVNTIGFPGSNEGFLQDLAALGGGIYADGTDVNNLATAFETVFNQLGSLRRLELELPDGTILSDFEPGLDGNFSVVGDIREGNNLFIARAYSSSNQVTEATLNVIGVSSIPEPTSCLLLVGLSAGCLLRRRRSRSRRFD